MFQNEIATFAGESELQIRVSGMTRMSKIHDKDQKALALRDTACARLLYRCPKCLTATFRATRVMPCGHMNLLVANHTQRGTHISFDDRTSGAAFRIASYIMGRLPALRQRVKRLQVPQPETGSYAIDHYTSPGTYTRSSLSIKTAMLTRHPRRSRTIDSGSVSSVRFPQNASMTNCTYYQQCSRRWGTWDYVAYWSTGSFAIYNYSTGSALIAFGLRGNQALGAGIFSPIVLAALAVLCGVCIFLSWSKAKHKPMGQG